MKKVFYLIIFCFCSILVHSQKFHQNILDSIAKRAEKTHSEAVIIYQNNQLIYESYWGIGKEETKIESMSCTKSIVGLTIACLLSDKWLDSLDVPVHLYYPEWKQGKKQDITIRHLVEMTSGLQNHPNASLEIYPSPDFVQLALAAELETDPGEVWSYNNKALNLIAGIIQKITGKRMDIYIQERLFKPMDIHDFGWSLDSVGNPHVMSGCQIKPKDFLKIGLLLANKGKYHDQQIIEQKFIEQVVQPSIKNAGYGWLWWLDHENVISTIDTEIINELTNAHVDPSFIKRLKKMKGVYPSNEAYFSKVTEIFGPEPWGYIQETLGANLRMRKKQFSGSITYRADGYLGNYIIVDPSNNIVAIRMISHQSFQTSEDNFNDFSSWVLKLAK